MTTIATRKLDKRAIETLVAKRKRIAALKEKLRKLELESEEAEQFLRAKHPNGIALDLQRGKALIVEFDESERRYVNLEKVRKLLKGKVPMRTVEVFTTRIVPGIIE